MQTDPQDYSGEKLKVLKNRLFAKREVVNTCWEWVGALNNRGYGLITSSHTGKRKLYLVHRISYMVYYGPIPDGMLVCHKCDNRKCFNPKHFFLGTHADNMRDCANKGRVKFVIKHGEDNPRALFSEATVREIVMSYANEDVTQAELGKRYGTTKAVIQSVISRRNWKHLKLPIDVESIPYKRKCLPTEIVDAIKADPLAQQRGCRKALARKYKIGATSVGRILDGGGIYAD
jgi:hypothetical protein